MKAKDMVFNEKYNFKNQPERAMKNYVKEYKGHKVPEGATHYAAESTFQRRGFYMWRGESLMYFGLAFHKGWVASVHSSIPESAIELPPAAEQELPVIDWNDAPDWADQIVSNGTTSRRYWANKYQYQTIEGGKIYAFQNTGGSLCDFDADEMRPEVEPEAWVNGLPPVGCECEVSVESGGVFEIATVKYISEHLVISAVGGHEYPSRTHITRFRPLKTQEQKDREAFVEMAIKEVEVEAGLAAPEKSIFEIMFDAGFTAPKGEA